MPGPNEGVRVVCHVLVVSAHAGKKISQYEDAGTTFPITQFLAQPYALHL
jgi:hypothetical protein